MVLNPGPVTHTSGGAVIHGSVTAGRDVIGRDQVNIGYTAEQVSLLIAEACARLPRNLTYAEWKQYIGAALPYQAICPNLPLEPALTPTPGQ